MKNTNNDELHSSNPLAIYLKKLAKKNKSNLSLMESQNIEANKIGFSNWHYFLKHLKNKFKNIKEHPFNPDNENKGLNPLLKPYIFNLGFNLDYGTQFYANKSQLRNRFTSLHSKDFNQQYILHSIQEFKKLDENYSLFCIQNKLGEINYNFDIYIDENHSSHYLKIPFTNQLLINLLDNFGDFGDWDKSMIFSLISKNIYSNSFFDLDDLIIYFTNISLDGFSYHEKYFNNIIKYIIQILNKLKNLSFFDKEKPEFIFNEISLSTRKTISITQNANNIFIILLQNIIFETFSFNMNNIDIKNQENKYLLSVLFYNIDIFPSYTSFFALLRAMAVSCFLFFDLDRFLENKFSIESILCNTAYFILPTFDFDFTKNFLEHLNYDTKDLNYYPKEWINNRNNFIITSYYHSFSPEYITIKNINLCSINKK